MDDDKNIEIIQELNLSVALTKAENQVSSLVHLVNWLIDGIEHFTHDDDREQVVYLIDEAKLSLERISIHW